MGVGVVIIKLKANLSSTSHLTSQLELSLAKKLLGDKLEEKIGDSAEAVSKGVKVILNKGEKWFGKEEDIEAFMNYKVFAGKSRNKSDDLFML